MSGTGVGGVFEAYRLAIIVKWSDWYNYGNTQRRQNVIAYRRIIKK